MAPKKTHKVTEETKHWVACMVRAGITHEQIARVLNICIVVLYKKYRDILDTELSNAVTKISNALFDKALNGDTTSMIFYLKTRGGWTETNKVEHSGNVSFVLPEKINEQEYDDHIVKEISSPEDNNRND